MEIFSCRRKPLFLLEKRNPFTSGSVSFSKRDGRRFKKETLKIIIEKSSDYYDAYAQNCNGIYGAGNTVDEAKQNVIEGLNLFIKYNKDKLPEILRGEYNIEYYFDVPSFLKHYSTVFTKSALQRMTGINQTQLTHYVSGFRKPSKKTIYKLDTAINSLSKELSQVHFI